MVAEHSIVLAAEDQPLAMATAESVDELRRSLADLRHEVETRTTEERVVDLTQGLEGLRQQVEAQVISGQQESLVTLRQEIGESFLRLPNQEEFYKYIQDMESKFEDDQATVKRQLAELKDSVDIAMTAISPGQAFAAADPGRAHNAPDPAEWVRWSQRIRRRRPVAGLAVHHRGLAQPRETGVRYPIQKH